jgi:hypothetical protein
MYVLHLDLHAPRYTSELHRVLTNVVLSVVSYSRYDKPAAISESFHKERRFNYHT